MPSQFPADRIRSEVFARLTTLQAAQAGLAVQGCDGGPAEMIETILIREGHYVGRRFRIEGAHAVWLESEAEIRFWSDAGELLEVLRLVDGEVKRVVA
jgi:hypothetical protein